MWEKDRTIDNYIEFLLHWNLFTKKQRRSPCFRNNNSGMLY